MIEPVYRVDVYDDDSVAVIKDRKGFKIVVEKDDVGAAVTQNEIKAEDFHAIQHEKITHIRFNKSKNKLEKFTPDKEPKNPKIS